MNYGQVVISDNFKKNPAFNECIENEIIPNFFQEVHRRNIESLKADIKKLEFFLTVENILKTFEKKVAVIIKEPSNEICDRIRPQIEECKKLLATSIFTLKMNIEASKMVKH